MIRIAHISDLHFGREQPVMAEQLLAEIDAAKPDLIAVSGDLTQSGLESELRAARTFLDRLAYSKVVVPGNHDLPVWHLWFRFTQPWARWRAIVEDDLAPVLRKPGLIAKGVNTARRSQWHHDWSRGRIKAAALTAVSTTFVDRRADDLCVLIAHHPFMVHDTRAAKRGLVSGAGPALPKLRAAGVDLVLGGHVHLAYAGVASGVVIAQSGTTFSDRLKGEPNGYNFIIADQDTITVEHHGWRGERYERDKATGFRRDAQGAWHAQPG